MKKNLKSNKGITLLAISVLIIVMLMVTSAIILRTTTMYKLKALRDMNNDLQILEESVGIYYSNYGTLPVLDGNVKNKIDYIYNAERDYTIATPINPEDEDIDDENEPDPEFYVIDLEVLEDVSLINGKEFDEYKKYFDDFDVAHTEVSDIYVISKKTHQVYYIKGVLVDNQFYCTLDSNNREETPQIPNPPSLTEGMIPIKWNGTNWVITSETDLEWYNYSENPNTSKWANVMLSDGRFKYAANDATLAVPGTTVAENELGSMFVWIPRYAYRITEGHHTNTAGNISILFLNGVTNTSRTKPGYVEKPDINNELNPYPVDAYIQHPAFTFGEDELEGIWIAKYTSSIRKASDNTWINQTSTQNNLQIGASNLKDYYIQSVPNRNTWRYTNVSGVFSKSIGMKDDARYMLNNADTHLMKNIELGAVSYLAESNFGINSEIVVNNNTAYLTGKGGSSTGNETGVYDLNGGTREYTAAYVNNENASLTTNGKLLLDAPAKYKDVYTKSTTTESPANNYALAANKVGDAIYETSINGNSTNGSWYGDTATFPQTTTPFMTRTGKSGTTAGTFNFERSNGTASVDNGFRVAIINLDNNAQYRIPKMYGNVSFYNARMPAKDVLLQIYDGATLVAEATTNSIGEFEIENLDNTKQYSIKLTKNSWSVMPRTVTGFPGNCNTGIINILMGDFDGNGIFDDSTIIYNNYGPVTESTECFDLNYDQVIDLADVGLCVYYYGITNDAL